MPYEFGPVLRKLREGAGYSSAYAFYHTNGGRRLFGVNYNQYLNIEQGRSLPRAPVVTAVATILRLRHTEGALGRLMSAYLRSLFGGEGFRSVLAPLLKPPVESRSAHPLGKAIAKARAGRQLVLGPNQAQIIERSASHYWALQIFSEDMGSWTVQYLAALLGFSQAVIVKVLNDFYRWGLIKKEKDGRYTSAMGDKIVVHPVRYDAKNPFVSKPNQSLGKHWDEMQRRKGGREIFRRVMTMRAAESELIQYIPYLAQATLGSEIYAVKEPKPDSAFYVVESRIRRIFRF
ncbi:MAG: hypothetical protein HYT79_01160 [Elusimicrobia bacterium]|nr:hypothetical protein [Elusimicrobiota bacterium]